MFADQLRGFSRIFAAIAESPLWMKGQGGKVNAEDSFSWEAEILMPGQ
jgi:hypothetical protein